VSVLAALVALLAALPVRAAAESAQALGIRYGDRAAQVLDAYAASRKNSPVLVVVHGGAWTKGDKRDVALTCETAVAKGFACFAVNYSLAPAFQWPVQLGELQDALGWTKANAASYGGNPSRIGFWGYSAGGQLALEAAYRTPGIKAVVSWSGPTDLVSWYTRAARRLLGCLSPCLTSQRDASPLEFVSTARPTFIVHSTRDATVPISQSQKLDARLTALKIPHTFLRLSGTGHARDQWNLAEAPTFTWLATHL
jgi:acetyl esterase/lipase